MVFPDLIDPEVSRTIWDSSGLFDEDWRSERMPSPDFQRARRYVNKSRLHVFTSHICSLLAGGLYVGWMVLLVFVIDLLDHKGIAFFDGDNARYASQIAPLPDQPAGTEVHFYRQPEYGPLVNTRSIASQMV